mgnify:CR=1 FL=1|tara:strand:- start:251 stop:2338 length:2088 start_codon:yes stop_codon:yes gene_type:complete
MFSTSRFTLILPILLACLAIFTHQSKADGILCNLRSAMGSYQHPYFEFFGTIEIEGNTAYIASRVFSDGWKILDITSPYAPQLLGSFHTDSIISDIDIAESTAFVLFDDTGLHIFDVSDPANPMLLGVYESTNTNRSLQVVGNKAYMTDRNGMHIIDVSNSSDPTRLSFTETEGQARGITVANDKAYVADGTRGLQVFDISTPSSPMLQGFYSASASSHVAVRNNFAYLCNGSKLEILNISDPTNIVQRGFYRFSDDAIHAVIEGNKAYVAADSAGLATLDISNPDEPVLIGIDEIPGPVSNSNGYAWGVQIVDDIAYVAARQSGLRIYDMSNPTTPPHLGTFDTESIYEFQIIGTTGYAANRNEGLQIIDLADPANPALIGSYNPTDSTNSVQVVGTTAYIAARTQGFQIVDISDPTQPTLLGSSDVSDFAQSIAVSGTTAYVADHRDGFQIFDVSDLTDPVLLGSRDTPGIATHLTIDGTTLYVSAGSGGLHILDVSNPDAPLLRSTLDITARSKARIVGTTAYVLGRYTGLNIFDVKDPSSPNLLGTYHHWPWDWDPRDIAVVGNIAYIADHQESPSFESNGLKLIDVSNPFDPTLLARYDIEHADYVYGVVVDNDTAYIAIADRGIHIVDVSDCESCPADLIQDGVLDFSDVANFLVAYPMRDYTVDFNQDGSYNYLDISEFLRAFSAGCP